MIATPLFKLIGSALSPAGASARLNILIYHRVLAQTDPIFPTEVTASLFDAQMALLKATFNVLPLHEAVVRLKAGTLPARAACITFDDGYADNLTLAAPILKKHGLHATFFIATGYLNGGRMFNDTVTEAVRRSPLSTLNLSALNLGVLDIASNDAKARAIERLLPAVKYLASDVREQTVARIAELAQCGPLPDDLMMSTGQLKALHAAGMGIGAHTARHPILARLDADAVRKEILEGKTFLEHALNTRIKLFAYPNGKPGTDYLPQQASIVRELGFEAAVSTQWGSAAQASELFHLPRFTPGSPQPARFILALLANLRRPIMQPESHHAQKQSLILLFGMPRSGTTWLGKIFDSHPDTLYRHEPDSRGTLNALPLFPFANAAERWRAYLEEYVAQLAAIRDEKVSASLPIFPKCYYAAPQWALRKLLVFGLKAASRLFGPLPVPNLIDVTRHPDVSIVWKSIESLGRLGVLARALPEARCVLILRHPCGYVASVLRGEARQEFEGAVPSSEDWDVFRMLLETPAAKTRGLTLPAVQALQPVERLALKWALYYEHALSETAGLENVLTVRYEDFCEQPQQATHNAFRHCRLTLPAQTEYFIAHSTSQNKDEYYSVFKDPKNSASKWQQELSAEDIGRITQAIAGYAASAYYADS